LQLRYQAIKILQERGWKFHNKFSTFFQLQGNSKVENEEFIEGKFKFFDFEQDWVMRTKKEFKFELAFLDDPE
jgi:CCR4-NOT transcriptional regulation complex NOT5 subunit